MTIGDTSHVMWQANDGEGRSVGPYARTLGCTWLETLRRDAPLDQVGTLPPMRVETYIPPEWG